MVIGCPNPNNAPEDTYTKVTDPSEMIGSWEGSLTIQVPAQEEFDLPASSISYTLKITVTADEFTEVIDVDMNQYLTDFFGPDGKETMWAGIKTPSEYPEDDSGLSLGNPENDFGFSFEYTKDYHIKMTFSGAVSDFDLSEEIAEYAPYINKDKTKMKIVLPEEFNEYGEEGAMEFILYYTKI
jgi:hypothetical protein